MYDNGNNFSSAYGVSIKGCQVDENGKVQYGCTLPAYKDFIALIANWYSEKLIDSDFISRRLEDARKMFINGRSGMVTVGNWEVREVLQLGQLENPDFDVVAIQTPRLTEPDALINLSWPYTSGNGETTFHIASTCDDPVLAMKWIDYLYTSEALELMTWGVGDLGDGNATYTLDENGVHKFTDFINNNPLQPFNFFSDIYFTRLLRNTLFINIKMLVFGFPIPVIFALMLNEVRSSKFRRISQSITYMPHFISSMVICGLMLDFCKSDGLITYIFTLFGGERINLFSKASWFQGLYVGMNIWQEFGWDSIIYFAALTAIDPSLYEAATVDGAGRWRQMLHVTLPGISATIVILLILRIGNLMSLGWEKVYLLYNEKIYETADIISTYVYRRGILEFQYSYATAVGLFNSVINIILLLLANTLSRRFSETSLW